MIVKSWKVITVGLILLIICVSLCACAAPNQYTADNLVSHGWVNMFNDYNITQSQRESMMLLSELHYYHIEYYKKTDDGNTKEIRFLFFEYPQEARKVWKNQKDEIEALCATHDWSCACQGRVIWYGDAEAIEQTQVPFYKDIADTIKNYLAD